MIVVCIIPHASYCFRIALKFASNSALTLPWGFCWFGFRCDRVKEVSNTPPADEKSGLQVEVIDEPQPTCLCCVSLGQKLDTAEAAN